MLEESPHAAFWSKCIVTVADIAVWTTTSHIERLQLLTFLHAVEANDVREGVVVGEAVGCVLFVDVEHVVWRRSAKLSKPDAHGSEDLMRCDLCSIDWWCVAVSGDAAFDGCWLVVVVVERILDPPREISGGVVLQGHDVLRLNQAQKEGGRFGPWYQIQDNLNRDVRADDRFSAAVDKARGGMGPSVLEHYLEMNKLVLE